MPLRTIFVCGIVKFYYLCNREYLSSVLRVRGLDVKQIKVNGHEEISDDSVGCRDGYAVRGLLVDDEPLDIRAKRSI